MNQLIKRLRDTYSGRCSGPGQETWTVLLDAANEIERLEEALDKAQLNSIEARNPGIDMEEVKYFRKHGHMRPKNDGLRSDGTDGSWAGD